MAALWESWGPADAPLETCTIITTAARGELKRIHERMPVILVHDGADGWLDATTSPVAVGSLLAAGEAELEAYPVTPYVNSPKNDDEHCWTRDADAS